MFHRSAEASRRCVVGKLRRTPSLRVRSASLEYRARVHDKAMGKDENTTRLPFLSG
jgi:hypothetical protein